MPISHVHHLCFCSSQPPLHPINATDAKVMHYRPRAPRTTIDTGSSFASRVTTKNHPEAPTLSSSSTVMTPPMSDSSGRSSVWPPPQRPPPHPKAPRRPHQLPPPSFLQPLTGVPHSSEHTATELLTIWQIDELWDKMRT
jgi:hypothetical protein